MAKGGSNKTVLNPELPRKLVKGDPLVHFFQRLLAMDVRRSIGDKVNRSVTLVLCLV